MSEDIAGAVHLTWWATAGRGEVRSFLDDVEDFAEGRGSAVTQPFPHVTDGSSAVAAINDALTVLRNIRRGPAALPTPSEPGSEPPPVDTRAKRNALQFTTSGRRSHHESTGGKPCLLQFVKPVPMDVTEIALPVTVPCGDGRLVVKRFSNYGVSFSEEGTVGDEVRAEVYLEAPRGSREWKRLVVNDLIDDAIRARESALGERGEVFYHRAGTEAQEAAQHATTILARDVPEHRHMFPHEDDPGYAKVEIVAFNDARIDALKRILDKL
jgi:hypothetical protein